MNCCIGFHKEILEELESVGWKRAKAKKVKQINSVDIRAIFNLVDVDRSGSITRTVCNDKCTVLKRFPISRKQEWQQN